MKEGVKSSPKLMKKTNGFSTTNLLKEKQYLPSRYAQQIVLNKNQLTNILNCIETNVKTTQIQKIKNPNSPTKFKLKQKNIEVLKKKQGIQFVSKPLKRQQSDFLQYKQIFIDPIKTNLDIIQQSNKKSDEFGKGIKQISKEYEKLLQFENGSKKKTDPNQQFSEQKDKQIKDYYQEAIKLLDFSQSNYLKNQEDFYQEQIRIQPPDFPNSTLASTLSPGAGYAPSIPLTSNLNKQTNLKQLLIRAKAGMNTEDIQKQAHLSFYLGIVYQQQRNYHSALKFYRRYLGFAKGLQDKIGMALGANRVAINYFYNNDIRKSIVFHNQNLKLSDNQNCFAGFYNLGICHRKIQQFQQSLQYFETAIQWASQNGETESQCITYGQLGVTYKLMGLFQKSLENFEKSLEYCRKLKNVKLQLKNLMNILLISSENELYSQNRIEDIIYQAYQCSKILGDKKIQEIFSVNIGIEKGKKQFEQFVQNQAYDSDIEEI